MPITNGIFLVPASSHQHSQLSIPTFRLFALWENRAKTQTRCPVPPQEKRAREEYNRRPLGVEPRDRVYSNIQVPNRIGQSSSLIVSCDLYITIRTIVPVAGHEYEIQQSRNQKKIAHRIKPSSRLLLARFIGLP